MIKEAIEKILSLALVQRLTIDGREYTDQIIYPVKESQPYDPGGTGKSAPGMVGN